MEWIMAFAVGIFVGWKLGRKYQDFQDIMLARRVAKLVEQREKIQKEKEQYEMWEQQDMRIGAKMREGAAQND